MDFNTSALPPLYTLPLQASASESAPAEADPGPEPECTGNSMYSGAWRISRELAVDKARKFQPQTADDRLRQLADWCKVGDNLKALDPSKQPDPQWARIGPVYAEADQYGVKLRDTLPFQGENTEFCNVLTLSNWQIALHRYKKYYALSKANGETLARLREQYGYNEEMEDPAYAPSSQISNTLEWQVFDTARKRKAALRFGLEASMRRAMKIYAAVHDQTARAQLWKDSFLVYVSKLDGRRPTAEEMEDHKNLVLQIDTEEEFQNGIAAYNPKEQCDEMLEVLEDVLENWPGNDDLKDMWYQTIMKFLKDGASVLEEYRHYVFMGPSGVGKTTWSRLMARLYKAAGIFMKGNLVETTANDYVGAWAGQSGPQTRAKLDSNLENVILFDEAYMVSEMSGSDKGANYGGEVITTLVDYMDKNRGLFMMIIAGYEDKMLRNENSFLEANQGLDRRFQNKYVFPSYTAEELVSIAKKMLGKRPGKKLELWEDRTWERLLDLIQYGMDAEAEAERDGTDSKIALWHHALFGKQGGSIENLVAKIEEYMSLPEKDLQVTKRAKFAYEPDLAQVLTALLPSEDTRVLSKDDFKRSEVYGYLHGPALSVGLDLVDYASDQEMAADEEL